MKEKNKTYTASDFARYYAGTMPTGEMHELEKAALEDPFLEDALEGYEYAPAPENDIKELRVRLDEKKRKQNIFFISSFAQNKWWRIAALFIIMAGAAYFFYKINYTNKINSLAKNEVKIPAEKKDSSTTIKAGNATTKNDLVFESQPALKLAKKGKPILTAPRASLEKQFVAPAPTIQPATVYSPADKSAYTLSPDSNRLRSSIEQSDSQVITGYALKGKVTDENGYPVPFANITEKGHRKATIADTAGRFLLRSKDSSITATASAIGYNSKSFLLSKDVQPTIAINKSEADLDEVVVTVGGQTKHLKKSSSVSKVLNGKVAGVQITSAGLQPSGGQEKFDQYLKDHKSPVYDESNDLVTGEVLLSFKINKKGRPKNIKVVKASCKACEEEAIKLLKRGPDWTGGKDSYGTVMIKF